MEEIRHIYHKIRHNETRNTAHLYTKFQINILIAIRIIRVLCITNFLQQFAQKGSSTGTRTITKPG